jgi:hypothetical protein
MAAGIFNITIEKRATFSFDSTFTQADSNALDLTNRTLSGEIRRNFDNGLEATFTIVKTNAAGGSATISLTKAQTAALTDNACTYDIFADHTDGTSLKLLTGSVTIVNNITSA